MSAFGLVMNNSSSRVLHGVDDLGRQRLRYSACPSSVSRQIKLRIFAHEFEERLEIAFEFDLLLDLAHLPVDPRDLPSSPAREFRRAVSLVVVVRRKADCIKGAPSGNFHAPASSWAVFSCASQSRDQFW